MRHRWTGRKLGRRSKHRRAMTRNLITSLIDEERVRTTLAKAKEVRRHVDRVITLGKRGTLHARRQAAAILRTPASVQKLMDTLGPRYADRHTSEPCIHPRPVSSGWQAQRYLESDYP